MSAAGIKACLSLRHALHLVVVDRSDVIFCSLPYYLIGRIRECCGAVENIQGLASLQLQIFRCFVVTAPGHKHDKRHHHAVEESEGIEDDCSYFVVLL